MTAQYGKYSDAELLLMLKGRKREAEGAFAELYSRYAHRIYAYALRITGSGEEAQDIFHDTFMKLFESAKKMNNVSNIPAYILKIVRNLCLNYKRRKKDLINIEDLNITTNDTAYEKKELIELMACALDCIDFEHKEAFVLRQYHGMPYHEIAEIQEVPVSTVKNRVWRAKEKIKQILSPYLVDLYK